MSIRGLTAAFLALLVICSTLGLFVWATSPMRAPVRFYDVSCALPKVEFKNVQIRAWIGPMTLVTKDGREIIITNSTQCVIERKD